MTISELMRGDVSKLMTLLKSSADCRTNYKKINKLLFPAMFTNQIDICQVSINSGKLNGKAVTQAMTVACICGHLSLAQLIVRRFRVSTQDMHCALCNASRRGHTEIVNWLVSEMKLSRLDNIRWLLATASARGDIKNVKLLAAETSKHATNVLSQALTIACYRGRVDDCG